MPWSIVFKSVQQVVKGQAVVSTGTIPDTSQPSFINVLRLATQEHRGFRDKDLKISLFTGRLIPSTTKAVLALHAVVSILALDSSKRARASPTT
jgi:hypothetical protein